MLVLLVLVVILLVLLIFVVVVFVLFVLLLLLLMIMLIVERHHAFERMQLMAGGLERLGQVEQTVRVLEDRVGVRRFEPGPVDNHQVGVGNRSNVVNRELHCVRVGSGGHERAHIYQIAPDLTHPVRDHLARNHNRDRFDRFLRRVAALLLLLLRLRRRGLLLRLFLLLRLLIVGAADDERRRKGQRNQGTERQPEEPGHRTIDLGGQMLNASGPSAGPSGPPGHDRRPWRASRPWRAHHPVRSRM